MNKFEQLRVCALYPELLNIYADRGNLLVLERRCRWRGIEFQLARVGIDEPLDPEVHNLFYLGGGQDRDQLLCAEDIAHSKAAALRTATEETGSVLLAVCGGYQLLGNYYELEDGRQVPGAGLVDLKTVREPGKRLIGNVAIELELHGQRQLLAGFENHGGRTYLGGNEQPLGRVLKGHGNNGHDRTEGVLRNGIVGTYLHGPLLPKNIWFADWLIATALKIDPADLPPLDDEFELAATAEAQRAAGV